MASKWKADGIQASRDKRHAREDRERALEQERKRKLQVKPAGPVRRR